MTKKSSPPKNERVYNIPLRKHFVNAPRTKRAKRAVRTVKDFVKRHMKVENVAVGKSLNEEIWKRGIQNPPPKVSVICLKDGDRCSVDLIGVAPVKKEQTEEKKDKKAKPKAASKQTKPKTVKKQKSN